MGLEEFAVLREAPLTKIFQLPHDIELLRARVVMHRQQPRSGLGKIVHPVLKGVPLPRRKQSIVRALGSPLDTMILSQVHYTAFYKFIALTYDIRVLVNSLHQMLLRAA